MNADFDLRLNGLLQGAWIRESEEAETFLRPPKALLKGLTGTNPIAVGDLEVAEKATTPEKRRRDIKYLLRAHWKSAKGIVEPAEISLRDSFDEALTSLHILELSAESSYLPEPVVVAAGRKLILNLLWSKGARSFVDDYDYLGVRFLAARCDIDLGLPKVTPPLPDPQAQAQFATFLSQHQGWYGDESLNWWLGLLDDYAADDGEFEGYEDDAFNRFLRSGKLPSNSPEVMERFYDRAEGLNHFLFLLSNLFSFLPPEVVPLYGSLYLYWMAKFFGYEFGENGYRREAALYHDWSRAAIGPVLCTTKPREAMVRNQVAIIRNGFKATKAFVQEHL